MIVTSKRCFLNVLTQLQKADTLLNSNYYIGDQASGTNNVSINDNTTFNDFGQLVQQSGVVQLTSKYYIKSNNVMNPEPHVTHHAVMGADDSDFASAEEGYIDHLNKPDTFLAVYNFLFKDQLQGNGQQIFMLNDDENMLRFGHIICQYLSTNFGVDIVYIDPAYRPNCRGCTQYPGNKVIGEKTIKDVRDYDLIFSFQQSLSQSELTGTLNNIRTFVGSMSIENVVYLYNLLWPNDPLPPGNYSIDHIREIIIGRAVDAVGVRKEAAFQNLFINDWRSSLDRMNREAEDFGADDGLF